MIADADFDAALDAHLQRLEDEAWQAELRSHEAAARPDADPAEVTFADLRRGDYMTNEGPQGRWVQVVDIRGPHASVTHRQQRVPDGHLSVLFEIPEPVSVSGETRYWIERPFDTPVLIDRTARRAGKEHACQS